MSDQGTVPVYKGDKLYWGREKIYAGTVGAQSQAFCPRGPHVMFHLVDSQNGFPYFCLRDMIITDTLEALTRAMLSRPENTIGIVSEMPVYFDSDVLRARAEGKT